MATLIATTLGFAQDDLSLDLARGSFQGGVPASVAAATKARAIESVFLKMTPTTKLPRRSLELLLRKEYETGNDAAELGARCDRRNHPLPRQILQ